MGEFTLIDDYIKFLLKSKSKVHILIQFKLSILFKLIQRKLSKVIHVYNSIKLLFLVIKKVNSNLK